MKKIRKGDNVVVVSGKDKGKIGEVLSCLDDDLILVRGVNVVREHVKPIPARGIAGGIVSKELPVHRSNIALSDSTTQKPSRVGFRFLETGEKVRFLKKSGDLIPSRRGAK